MALLDERYSPAELHELAVELDGRPVPNLRVSEAEFESLVDEDVRAEWVDGEVIVMPPVSGEHADISGWLYRFVSDFVEERHLGLVRGPEFQVRFAAQRRRRTPDLLFVARSRLKIVKRTYVDGPPDLIMEVVSPESASRDWRDKFLDYQSAGVKEYWIIDPASRRLEAYTLSRARRYVRLAETEGAVHSKVLRGLLVRPSWLWRFPLPRLVDVKRQRNSRRS